jgi:hypothetical protein
MQAARPRRDQGSPHDRLGILCRLYRWHLCLRRIADVHIGVCDDRAGTIGG